MLQSIANRIDSSESECSNSKIIWPPFCIFNGLEANIESSKVCGHLLPVTYLI